MTNCKGMNPKTISILAVLLLGANILTTATADPLQIIFTDQPNQITIGSEVHLTCVVSGGNDPHVTWISPTGLLPVNSHITNGGRTLLITNYDVTENGQYICVASDGQEFANHVFTLSAQHTETHPTATTSTTTTTSPTTTAPTTTTTSATTHSATHGTGPLCMNCRNVISPYECHMTTRCGIHEQCYIEKYVRNNLVLYDLGCRSNIVCNATSTMNIGTLVGKRGNQRAEDDGRISVCEACCKNNNCNNGGACGAPRPPTVLSMVVHPTNYHYGGDVHIVCTVESNPPHTMLGWNMMTDPNHIPSNIHLNYGTNKVTVNIKHLTDANIGKYQCFVRNSLGQDAQSFLLHPPK
uniref:Uncharacterized protein LOC111113201 n=1 Tax=Crassostrea virginica TaxID=6565 RepID=A0A8B8BVT9_CRAVI|nr:uncharacterized protein LOC111113201 [Crassostrea virginica]